MRSGDAGDYNDYRYEYDSGVWQVAQANSESDTEIYIANRGGELHVARVFIYLADVPGSNTQKFDSGVAVLPPHTFCLLTFRPGQHSGENFRMYWARAIANSRDLVVSMQVWRTKPGTEPRISDAYFAPGDFAMLELPANRPLEALPIGPVAPTD
jgi:hypothetical protein